MSLPQDRRPRGRRHQVAAAPRAARPRWSSSTSTTPTSRLTSTGRCRRSRRSPRWSTGSKICAAAPRRPCCRPASTADGRRRRRRFDPTKNPKLQREPSGSAPADGVPDNVHLPARAPVRRAGRTRTSTSPSYDTDWDGEAYITVSRPELQQLACASPTRSCEAVDDDGDWELTDAHRRQGRARRVQGPRPVGQDRPRRLGRAPIPGLQFHTTINDWHTCPADGAIRASNPCSEYMFLDDTACNLASLNLLAFHDATTGAFDVDALRARRAGSGPIVLEISVLMAQFPSQADRRSRATTTAPSASASPTSARC
ncbi:MAG: hypothetical protein MZV49_27385 [Rhodopseudomonas palustris]|nr:hypothetical protein [Rhodopseudomonas palustris]